MGIFSIFGGQSNRQVPSNEFPNIFPLPLPQVDFLRIDVETIYSKILTDTLERTHGLTSDEIKVLFDNCLGSEQQEGLITMLSKAMTSKTDLFLVYERAVNILRKANSMESAQIKLDYANQGESDVGFYISFRNYLRSDMLRLYSALEYCTIEALNKSMNIQKTIQVKISELRSSVSLTDSEVANLQAKAIADGMSQGKDVLLDAKDMIETAIPQLTAVNQSMTFINQKRSFYLGLPESYMVGIQTGGLGTSGENDTKAIERGLRNYFLSILKPVLESLFQKDVTYKSQDFRQVDLGLRALQTFGLVDDALISTDEQRKIIEILFDFQAEVEA